MFTGGKLGLHLSLPVKLQSINPSMQDENILIGEIKWVSFRKMILAELSKLNINPL